jgi:hypothetical protein
LLEAAGALVLLLGAMTFTISESPEGVAVDEEGAQELAVPFIVVEFDSGVPFEHEVLLEVTPE